MAIEQSRLLTYDDYAALPDDGHRYELINGEIYVCPSPTTLHQRIAFEIAFTIRLYLDGHPLGEVLVAPLDVVLGEGKHQTFQPDVLFVSDEHRPIITEKNIQGAPDLVVEVVSPGTADRDLGAKRYAYDRHGVTEYWVVWSTVARIEVYRRQASSKFGKPVILDASDTLTTDLLPGYSLELSRLYRDLPEPQAL